MTYDDSDPTHLNKDPSGPVSNNEIVEKAGQNMSPTSATQLHTNFMDTQTDGSLRTGVDLNQER